MIANLPAVLILLWLVLAISFVGLVALWFWERNESRAFRKEMERLRADRS